MIKINNKCFSPNLKEYSFPHEEQQYMSPYFFSLLLKTRYEFSSLQWEHLPIFFTSYATPSLRYCRWRRFTPTGRRSGYILVACPAGSPLAHDDLLSCKSLRPLA